MVWMNSIPFRYVAEKRFTSTLTPLPSLTSFVTWDEWPAPTLSASEKKKPRTMGQQQLELYLKLLNHVYMYIYTHQGKKKRAADGIQTHTKGGTHFFPLQQERKTVHYIKRAQELGRAKLRPPPSPADRVDRYSAWADQPSCRAALPSSFLSFFCSWFTVTWDGSQCSMPFNCASFFPLDLISN